jgi:hypothetical protein
MSLDGQQPPQEAPPVPPDPHANDARQWAGDPYDEGDETPPEDPSVTSRFSDPNGEEAWLERAQDGTLTGWVRDATGQVYRYSDADAWAIDVDDAGLTPSGGGGGQPAPDPNADPAADPNAEPAADPNADPFADPAADPNADPSADPAADQAADPNEDPNADGQDNQPPWLKKKK